MKGTSRFRRNPERDAMEEVGKGGRKEKDGRKALKARWDWRTCPTREKDRTQISIYMTRVLTDISGDCGNPGSASFNLKGLGQWGGR